ncbi:MAG TPA: Xaa-Pro peptidase family protein [Candidatus Sulfotelmatobacter sp.]|nr:Xaa-Pro peptidase family protein [Candidatus Sulfotelmatobacter sp.]
MISRRRFLEASGITAGIAVAGGQRLAAGTAECADEKLPASIAALNSRKAEAKPIKPDERAARWERARQLMAENSLDAILLMEGTSLKYFTGIRWWGGERTFALLLPQKGSPFYVCPAFEEGRAREQITNAPEGSDPDVRVWQEDQSPYDRIAQGLKDRGIAHGRIGIEETVRFVFTEGISRAASQAAIASASSVTAGCRMIKSPHEIALMRLAAQVTLAAYQAAHAALQDGMTQPQVEDLVRKAHDRLGFTGDADVQVGEFSAFPHGSVTPQVIHEGTIVLMDGGCSVEGYASDITRTFVLGKASGKMKSVFDIVRHAQSAALAAAHPGVECGAIDDAARKVVTEGGYGPDYKYFTHRLGHGMGMDGHEWPYLVRGNKTKLQANMTTSDEPGIYIRGEFGIRLEDDMHVTENGAELFTPQSPSLEDPFAKG